MNGIMGCERGHRILGRNLDFTSAPLGEFYHVIVRGNQRQIFRDDRDRLGSLAAIRESDCPYTRFGGESMR
jgi:hypothetical protein